MGGPAVDSTRQPAGLRDLRAALASRPDLVGHRFCAAYTAAVDAWLRARFAEAVADGGARRRRLCLLAIGGYGRGDLCPHSDLDVILVHDDSRDVEAVARALWYPLWDSGVPVDHSVKTPRQALRVAAGDLKAALSLLDGRPVAGDSDLGRELVDAARAQWRRRWRAVLPELRAAQEARWASHGEIAFHLEPDLKRGRGGLRDVAAVESALLALAVELDPLHRRTLDEAAARLLDVRVALQLVGGRPTDRLGFAEQDGVATRLRLADADALLIAVADAARRVDWVADDVWRRASSMLAGVRPPTRPDEVVDDGIVVRDGALTLAPDGDGAPDLSRALRLAVAAVERDLPLHPDALERLGKAPAVSPERWTSEARHALLDLLAGGPAAVGVLERLDHVGILQRVIPEWAGVRSRPQRNRYHRYTVDRHLHETAAVAASLGHRVTRPDLLVLAAWLHDIGKGRPGDHSEAGAAIARTVGTRIGLAADDVETLVLLVREHLLLTTMATRFDVDDPFTAETVAARIGSGERLDLLAALTEADGRATGPGAWGPSRAALVTRLVARVHERFAGHAPAVIPRPMTELERTLVDRHELCVAVDDLCVTVAAPDTPGLLAVIAGVFALHRVAVREAIVGDVDGVALDVFDVELNRPDPPDWRAVERDLRRGVGDRAWLDAALTRRAQGGRHARSGAPSTVVPRVVVHDAITPQAVVVEVRAADRPGLLHDLADTISGRGFDITSARAVTLGHEAVDAFYLVDAASRSKPADPTSLADLAAALHLAADPSGGGDHRPGTERDASSCSAVGS